MPAGIPAGARCVQRFDDSLNSAIHITYRISLRSSSMREPRDPLLKVVTNLRGTSPPKVRFIAVVCVYGVSPPDRCTSGLIVGRARPAPHRSTPAKAEQGAERDRHSQ